MGWLSKVIEGTQNKTDMYQSRLFTCGSSPTVSTPGLDLSSTDNAFGDLNPMILIQNPVTANATSYTSTMTTKAVANPQRKIVPTRIHLVCTDAGVGATSFAFCIKVDNILRFSALATAGVEFGVTAATFGGSAYWDNPGTTFVQNAPVARIFGGNITAAAASTNCQFLTGDIMLKTAGAPCITIGDTYDIIFGESPGANQLLDATTVPYHRTVWVPECTIGRGCSMLVQQALPSLSDGCWFDMTIEWLELQY